MSWAARELSEHAGRFAQLPALILASNQILATQCKIVARIAEHDARIAELVEVSESRHMKIAAMDERIDATFREVEVRIDAMRATYELRLAAARHEAEALRAEVAMLRALLRAHE